MDFSVVIPTYGRAEQLTGCLDALSRLRYPAGSFEVIVVDDGSDTPPVSVVDQAAAGLNVRLLREPHRGPASARNAGAAAARGRYIAFTDDDCRPDAEWLRALAARFDKDPVCVVGGKTVNALDNVYSAASQLLVDYLYSYYNAEPGNARMLASNNFAMPADLFRNVGGFDVRFPVAAAEDRELCDRIRYLGYHMMYAPEAVVHHQHPLSLWRFWRQHFNYGTGAFRYHQVRASRTREGIRVESASYYWRLLRYPMTEPKRHRISLTALMFLSQVANAAGFFRQKLAYSLSGSHRND